MGTNILTLFLLSLVAIAAAFAYYRFKFIKKREKENRTSSILSSIKIPDEDLDSEAEFKEIKSHHNPFYRISGFKWIICVIFTLLILFISTFEYWIDFIPEPQIDKAYPITLKAAYTFTFKRVHHNEGETLINRGEVISSDDIELIKEYKQRKIYPPISRLIGIFVLYLTFTLFLLYWLSVFLTEADEDENKTLVFIFTSILILMALAKFSILTSLFSIYYVPLATLGMLATILVSNKIVPPIVLYSSIFLGVLVNFNMEVFLVLFGGALITVFWLQKVKKRSQLISAGLAVGFVNSIIYITIIFLRGHNILVYSAQQNLIATFANGLISGFLTLLSIPFFEKLFGYLSPFKLMELADLDSDLLRELYLKAPGTYHHSLSVANLAEIAANEIGADAMLLRVGSYYHDIGKMFKPKFYVENINDPSENPHNKISPYASSKILKSHVTIGIEVGEKYGLPRKIINLIPQHHGTSIMDFFYEKAKESSDNDSIAKKYFSYPGPRPKTKEAAILMIVDSVEAASRVLTDHSEITVTKMIEKIVAHKLEEGQLDEAPLKLSELRRIIYALAKALSTSTHKRIDYPSETGINSSFNTKEENMTQKTVETDQASPGYSSLEAKKEHTQDERKN